MRKHRRELGARHWGARTTRLRRTRKPPLVSQRFHVHRIPLHVRDDAYAPFWCGTGENIALILDSEKQKYFCTVGLTRFSKARPSGKSVGNREEPISASVIHHQRTEIWYAVARMSGAISGPCDLFADIATIIRAALAPILLYMAIHQPVRGFASLAGTTGVLNPTRLRMSGSPVPPAASTGAAARV